MGNIEQIMILTALLLSVILNIYLIAKIEKSNSDMDDLYTKIIALIRRINEDEKRFKETLITVLKD
jgi:hypothetical protein